MNYLKAKAMIEPILALLLILVLAPLLVLVALLIMIDSEGSPFFIQKRLGRMGKPFDMIKFRTMYPESQSKGMGVYSYKGDPRITRLGHFLRRTSLDELPQLWNILIGEMSFIGPRPVLTEHPWPYDQYSDLQKRRFEVKPGVTGLAQVNGRKTLPWETRIKYDIEYIDGQSLKTDLSLLLKTIMLVLTNEGNHNTQVTNKKEN